MSAEQVDLVGRVQALRDGIWISADGRERYIGGFYHGRYEGRGVLYSELNDQDF